MNKLLPIALFLAFAISQHGVANASFLGTKTSVQIVCPKKPAKDPEVSFRITNNDTVPLQVRPELPIVAKVTPVVKDAAGTVMPRKTHTFTIRPMMYAPVLLEPGKSMILADKSRSDFLALDAPPLSDFGYELTPGHYTLTATVTDSPDEKKSNVCSVTIP